MMSNTTIEIPDELDLKDLTPEQVAKVERFKEEYIELVRRHGISLTSCSCCGGLGLSLDVGLLSYIEGPLDPNRWK